MIVGFNGQLPHIPVAVDRFNIRNAQNIQSFFLSHFHYDHYIGLSNSFFQKKDDTFKYTRRIYCSEITKRLILTRFPKIPSERIVSLLALSTVTDIQFALEMERTHLLQVGNGETIGVTLLNANHCPGSVMYSSQL